MGQQVVVIAQVVLCLPLLERLQRQRVLLALLALTLQVRLERLQRWARRGANSVKQATTVPIQSLAQHVLLENIVPVQQRQRHRRAQIVLQENMVCNMERKLLQVALRVLLPFPLVLVVIICALAVRDTLPRFQRAPPSRLQEQEQCKRLQLATTASSSLPVDLLH